MLTVSLDHELNLMKIRVRILITANIENEAK